MRLTILNKTVSYDSFDCETCYDTGEYYDDSLGRRTPCPDCGLGRHR